MKRIETTDREEMRGIMAKLGKHRGGYGRMWHTSIGWFSGQNYAMGEIRTVYDGPHGDAVSWTIWDYRPASDIELLDQHQAGSSEAGQTIAQRIQAGSWSLGAAT